jgi:hypothetical protein
VPGVNLIPEESCHASSPTESAACPTLTLPTWERERLINGHILAIIIETKQNEKYE